MAEEDSTLEEAMDNLKEAGQRIRAPQSLMRSQGMTDSEDYCDLLTRLSTARLGVFRIHGSPQHKRRASPTRTRVERDTIT
jgi:hypothetical protein